MEYYPAGNLHTCVEDRRGLPEDECRQITSQVLSGIALMHEEGFAHRDLKPQVSTPSHKTYSLSIA